MKRVLRLEVLTLWVVCSTPENNSLHQTAFPNVPQSKWIFPTMVIQFVPCVSSPQVGVHYASTEFKYNETKQSVREEQYFTLETDTARETQKLTVLVNVTTLDVESPPTVEISWGGRTTPPMSVFDLNDTDLGMDCVHVHYCCYGESYVCVCFGLDLYYV